MRNIFLDSLRKEINAIPRQVTLVAVTKSVGVSETNEVIRAGVKAIGENRVEDFERKCPLLLPAEKHFIGQIQSRKIRRVVELFDVIQSVGSIEHLQIIEKEAQAQDKWIKILLQFNISREEHRGGFNRVDIEEVATSLNSLSLNSRELTDKRTAIPENHHIQIIGVMGIASDTKDTEVVRKQFRLLKNIRDQLQAKFPEIKELSMGMSDDYKIALEEGATMLRIGRALFSA